MAIGTKRRKSTGHGWFLGVLLVAAALGRLAVGLRAEDGAGSEKAVEAGAAGDRKPQQNVHQLSGDYPSRPSIAPSWSIPYEPLGLAAPGALYLGERNVLVSLDFLSEDRLLFTFRVPGLLHREPGDSDQAEERCIRAVVLGLPSGTVQAEATWIVHDRGRYLWALDDGHFLLRDRDSLLEGDATLKLTPFLRFPGRVLTLEFDPDEKYLVTNSREPSQTQKSTTAAGDAAASVGSAGDDADVEHSAERDLVARVLRRDSGEVVLVDRVHEMVRLPHNEDGYLDILRGDRNEWDVELNYFSGGHKMMGTVLSTCTPDLDFVSESVVLATACSDMGDLALVALNTDGEKLWTDLTPDREVWPLLRVPPGGLRFLRESLYVTHAVNAFAPIGDNDVRGQWVQVLNDANGEVAFESPAAPIFDGGGNVAISPSGRRVAVINNGAVQVFELPAAPTLPAGAAKSGRP
jgi:hypothetical protein